MVGNGANVGKGYILPRHKTVIFTVLSPDIGYQIPNDAKGYGSNNLLDNGFHLPFFTPAHGLGVVVMDIYREVQPRALRFMPSILQLVGKALHIWRFIGKFFGDFGML